MYLGTKPLFAVVGVKKKFFAIRALIMLYSQAEPWNLLDPDLVVTLTEAPEANPCSAFMLLVTTLTAETASVDGVYAVISGSQGYISLTPSIRVLLLLPDTPFALNIIVSAGVPASECCSPGGEKPGRTTNRLWKLRILSPAVVTNVWTSVVSNSEVTFAVSVCKSGGAAFTVTT